MSSSTTNQNVAGMKNMALEQKAAAATSSGNGNGGEDPKRPVEIGDSHDAKGMLSLKFQWKFSY